NSHMRPRRHPPGRASNQRATSGQLAENVTAQDIHWLLTHLRAVVVTSTAVWAGRGMTLVQLTVLHLISALAPMTLTELAQALGTKPPATSAMVDRLVHAGWYTVPRTPTTIDASSSPLPPPPSTSSVPLTRTLPAVCTRCLRASTPRLAVM